MQVNLRKTALDILQAGLKALAPDKILTEKLLDEIGLLDKAPLYLIGFGKGVRFYAKCLEEILGTRLKAGMVNDIQALSLSKVIVNQASHPLPDEVSVNSR